MASVVVKLQIPPRNTHTLGRGDMKMRGNPPSDQPIPPSRLPTIGRTRTNLSWLECGADKLHGGMVRYGNVVVGRKGLAYEEGVPVYRRKGNNNILRTDANTNGTLLHHDAIPCPSSCICLQLDCNYWIFARLLVSSFLFCPGGTLPGEEGNSTKVSSVCLVMS